MFQIYRRRLFPDGRLGAEQRVTPESVEDAMKPFPSRLANGKVLLCFVQGLERSGGFPVRERVDALVLDRDAP
jgi:hypothetical protein